MPGESGSRSRLARCFQVHSTHILIVALVLSGLQRTLDWASWIKNINCPSLTNHFGTLKRAVEHVRHPYMIYKAISFRFRYPLNPFGRYASVAAEQEYWRRAARVQEHFRHSDSRMKHPADEEDFFCHHAEGRTITFYTPRLLPRYRGHREERPAAPLFTIPVDIFIQWYRVIHPTYIALSVRNARVMMDRYSRGDYHEMLRIVHIFKRDSTSTAVGDPPRTKYQRMWQNWKARKDNESIVIFTT